jgi:hypothetical protein
MRQRPIPKKKIALAMAVLLLLMGIIVSISTGDPPFSTNKKVNSGPDTNRVQPSLAVDSEGNVYAAWGDRRNNNWDVYFTKSIDQGNSWITPDFQVTTDISNQTYPSIAVNSSGTLYAVWEDDRNGDLDIYFANSTDSGSTWSNPNVRVSTDLGVGDPNKTQSAPEIAVDSEGTIHVVWQDMRGPDSDIFYAKSIDSGQTWSNPNTRVNQDSLIVDQNHPSIAVGPTDTIYVAWEENTGYGYDIFLSKSEDKGITWSDPHLKVSSDSGPHPQENPSIDVDSNGNIYIAWQDKRDEDEFEIYFAGSFDDGATWTYPNVRVDNSSVERKKNPSLTVSDTGTIYIAWEDSRGSDRDIYLAYSINQGFNWSKPVFLVNDDNMDKTQLFPSIAVGPVGPVHVAWQDARFNVNDIYSAHIDQVHPFSSVDLLKVEGFLGGTPEIGHIIAHQPKFSFSYFDPFSTPLSQYNISLWNEDTTSLLWFCNATDTSSSGSEITVTYNTDPCPENGPDLLDGNSYNLKVKVANESGFWSLDNEVDFHMNEILKPKLPVSPSDNAQLVSVYNQIVVWTSPDADSEGDLPESYSWQVARDSQFTNIVESGSALVTESNPFDTRPSGTFYWRVSMSDGWETSSYGNQPDGFWDFTSYTSSGANNPPTITNKAGAPKSGSVGTLVSFTFIATDPDNDPLSWSKTAGPAWLNLGSDNGTVYGIPLSDNIGSDTFTVQVGDGRGGFDNHTFTISITSDGNGDGDPQDDSGILDFESFLWLLILLFIVIVILILLFLLFYKRKSDEEEEQKEHEEETTGQKDEEPMDHEDQESIDRKDNEPKEQNVE